jgi:hypothetical protein
MFSLAGKIALDARLFPDGKQQRAHFVISILQTFWISNKYS